MNLEIAWKILFNKFEEKKIELKIANQLKLLKSIRTHQIVIDVFLYASAFAFLRGNGGWLWS